MLTKGCTILPTGGGEDASSWEDCICLFAGKLAHRVLTTMS